MEPYEFIDIEGALVALVRERVGVEAATGIKNPRPREYVQLTRVGGPADWYTDDPMITFIAWGPSGPRAYALIAAVRRQIWACQGSILAGVQVYRVREVGGPVWTPDPSDGSPRYQFTAQIKLRGSEAA